MEKALLEFEDEDPVLHNMYPETDDEETGTQCTMSVPKPSDGRRGGSQSGEFDRGVGNLFEGQVFFNGVAFKEAVLDYALKTGRNIRQWRYDKTKVSYVCRGKSENGDSCAWRIYCSTSEKKIKWQVKTFKQAHSCIPNGVCEMLKGPVIAHLFLDKIREEPEYYMPMKIEEMILDKWGIKVTRNQCQSARNKALRWIQREYDEQFAKLRDYCREILDANKGSTVALECIRNEQGEDVFDRFYVCFDVIRKSWKETCRPIIGLDGCHLRHKMKGQLLVAMGRDADNAIYPIAWAVVQAETKDNWLWFVRKLKADFDLQDGDGYIMMSDRHRGLIAAVDLELPQIEHRKCVRHIYANMRALHGKNPEMKKLIWRLAWSYKNTEYEENLDKIFCFDSAVHANLMKTKPKTWCRAYHKIGNFCEDVENNSTESWNGSIVKARDKPLVPMLETIARMAMVRIARRGYKVMDWQSVCTPYVIDYLALEHKKARLCQVYISTNSTFEVKLSGCSYRVSLIDRTCTCRRWEITGIPCEHAYAVIINKMLEAEDYVCHWFRTALWRRTYQEGLVPMRGARFWPVGQEPPVHQPPRPESPPRKKGETHKVSKKDKERKKGKNESPVKKAPKILKRVMHCGICGAANHNSRFHDKKKKKGFEGESSRDESSQVQTSQGNLTPFESSQGTLTQLGD
ncbi:uncharacterized protein LOC112089933 [Eutrema salsugineum]|uniref:uncharacterized protein LOC112089933 n=1 Tax=Eutrema salsugineum TaxID=72664 RepID=UPI000CED0FBE|nr:uncharacterized protein LOC112089933 [Eutrema salsugineum]